MSGACRHTSTSGKLSYLQLPSKLRQVTSKLPKMISQLSAVTPSSCRWVVPSRSPTCIYDLFTRCYSLSFSSYHSKHSIPHSTLQHKHNNQRKQLFYTREINHHGPHSRNFLQHQHRLQRPEHLFHNEHLQHHLEHLWVLQPTL